MTQTMLEIAAKEIDHELLGLFQAFVVGKTHLVAMNAEIMRVVFRALSATDLDERVVEAAAQGIHDQEMRDHGRWEADWKSADDLIKTTYRENARAALSAAFKSIGEET